MIEYALAYARLGWKIVPSYWLKEDGGCSCYKGLACGKSSGKHPIPDGWQNIATSDETQVRAWWTQYPSANISGVTGSASGFFVVDVDGDDGYTSIDEYDTHGEGLPDTLRSVTGSGGLHILFKVPDGLVIRNSVKKLMPGVDVRGDGGQIILPPSTHLSGNRYVWQDESRLPVGPADPPLDLLEMLDRANVAGAAGSRRDTSDIPSDAVMLSGLSEGSRNDTTYRWAQRLRRTMAPHEVESMVYRSGRASGLPDSEIRVLVESVFKADHSPNADINMRGVGKERLAWAKGLAPTDDGSAKADALRTDPAGEFAMTDKGNADRLEHEFGDRLKYSSATGWWHWNSRAWETGASNHASVYAMGLSGLWLQDAEAAGEDAPTERDAFAKWAKKCESATAVNASLSLARHLPGIYTNDEEFDGDPWLLNLYNGVLDLKSGVVRARRREDLFTKMSPVTHDPSAICPRWSEFMEMILPDASTRWFVQKALGYSLTGSVSSKVFFVLHGAGNNGKSMMLETIYNVIFGGSGTRGAASYATRPHREIVVKPHGNSQHDTIVAALRGARFGFSSDDFERGDRFNNPVIKKITGGDSMFARFMNKDGFNFTPQVKLWIATNERPGTNSVDESTKTRLRIVPFTFAFGPDTRRDADEVKAEFKAETAGILNWMLTGLAGWREEGLTPSTEMNEELDDFIESNDAVGQFITERCEPCPIEEGAKFNTIFQEYEAWAKTSGSPRLTGRLLREDLKARPAVNVLTRLGRQGSLYGLRIRPLSQYGLPLE